MSAIVVEKAMFVCFRGWSRSRGEVGPKETTGAVLGSVTGCPPLGSKLDQ